MQSLASQMQEEDGRGPGGGPGGLITSALVDFSVQLLNEHPVLKSKVPDPYSRRDEYWNTFVRDLFLVVGYDTLDRRRGGQGSSVTRDQIVIDLGKLMRSQRNAAASGTEIPMSMFGGGRASTAIAAAAAARELREQQQQQQSGASSGEAAVLGGGAAMGASAADTEGMVEVSEAALRMDTGVLWVRDLLLEFDIDAICGCALELLEPSHVADLLAFEIGQKAIWYDQFQQVRSSSTTTPFPPCSSTTTPFPPSPHHPLPTLHTTSLSSILSHPSLPPTPSPLPPLLPTPSGPRRPLRLLRGAPPHEDAATVHIRAGGCDVRPIPSSRHSGE